MSKKNIVYLTDEDSRSNFPVVIGARKYEALAKKLKKGASPLFLSKIEAKETRQLYDKKKFEHDDEPVTKTLEKLLAGEDTIVYENKTAKGGRIFLGAGIDEQMVSLNIMPYEGKEVEDDEDELKSDEDLKKVLEHQRAIASSSSK